MLKILPLVFSKSHVCYIIILGIRVFNNSASPWSIVKKECTMLILKKAHEWFRLHWHHMNVTATQIADNLNIVSVGNSSLNQRNHHISALLALWERSPSMTMASPQKGQQCTNVYLLHVATSLYGDWQKVTWTTTFKGHRKITLTPKNTYPKAKSELHEPDIQRRWVFFVVREAVNVQMF